MNVRRSIRFPTLGASIVFAAALVVVPRFAYAQQQAMTGSVNFGTHGIGLSSTPSVQDWQA